MASLLRSQQSKHKLFQTLTAKFAAHGRNPSPISPPKTLQHLHHRHFVSSSSFTAAKFAARSLLRPSPPAKAAATKVRLYFASCSVGVRGLFEDGARAFMSLQRRRGKPDFQLGKSLAMMRHRWRNMLPGGQEVVLGLIGANIAVFLLWRIADPAFMRRNFMVSLDNLQNWRLHTLITSAFSHSEFTHLFTNMLSLYFFGKSLGEYFGSHFLLKLYLSGALAGSIFFLVHKALMVPSSKGYRGWDESRVPGLGASGAVNAVLLLYIFLFPRSTIYFDMLIPLPAAVLGGIYILTDLWRTMSRDGRISGEAHLGGAVVAALWWYRIKKGWI